MNFKSAIFSMAIVATAPALALPPKSMPLHKAALPKPLLFDFKGAQLGITIEKWRALPMPLWIENVPPEQRSRSQSLPAASMCSSDNLVDSYGMNEVSIDKSEKDIGVVVCQYKRIDRNGTNNADIAFGDGGTNYVIYKFFQNRLYSIEISANVDLLQGAMEGLVAKWGQPNRRIVRGLTNRIGGTVPAEIDEWRSADATITLEAPTGSPTNMAVTYSESKPAAEVARALKAARPDINKM